MLNIDNRFFDIRVLVQKNSLGEWSISGSLSRLSFQHYFITNYCYKICKPEDILSSIKLNADNILKTIYKLSLVSASTIEKRFGQLGEISVDFCIDINSNPYIIVINGKPDKSLFIKLGDKQIIKTIFQRPIEYAKFLS